MITMMEPLSSETQPAAYGAKGAGEIACVPPMACIANAIFNATGVRINKPH